MKFITAIFLLVFLISGKAGAVEGQDLGDMELGSTWQDLQLPEVGNISHREDIVSRLTANTLMAINELRPITNPNDEALYLLPIKKQVGLVIVYSDAHGSHSDKAIQALMALKNQIDFSQEYIYRLMKTNEGFNPSIALLRVRETIEDLLD
jgi:hypothetical protein